jgi:hypothetical protein
MTINEIAAKYNVSNTTARRRMKGTEPKGFRKPVPPDTASAADYSVPDVKAAFAKKGKKSPK